MIKKNDLWSMFLIAVHIFLLQKVTSAGQSMMTTNPARYGGNVNPVFWLKTGITSIFIFFFFNSLYRTLGLVSSSEEKFDVLLRQTLTALFWLLSLFLILSIFPQT